MHTTFQLGHGLYFENTLFPFLHFAVFRGALRLAPEIGLEKRKNPFVSNEMHCETDKKPFVSIEKFNTMPLSMESSLSFRAVHFSLCVSRVANTHYYYY